MVHCSYNEIQTFPYKVHLTSCLPTSLTSTPVILPGTHCTLATLAFLLFFEHVELILTFPLLVPLPGISQHQTFSWLAPPFHGGENINSSMRLSQS